MKLCFLGEVKERCALKQKILEKFCFLLAQKRPQIPSGPAGERCLVGPIQKVAYSVAYSVNFRISLKDPGIPPVYSLEEDRDLRDGYSPQLLSQIHPGAKTKNHVRLLGPRV